MPSPQVSQGTIAKWGLTAAQPSFLIQSQNATPVSEKMSVANHVGNTIGVLFYDERIEWDFTALIPATGTLTNTIGSTIVLANTLPTANLFTSLTVTNVVEGMKFEFANKDYQKVSMNGVGYPNF